MSARSRLPKLYQKTLTQTAIHWERKHMLKSIWLVEKVKRKIQTGAECPCSVWMDFPVDMSQTLSLVSREALIRRLSSGEKSHLLT